VLRIEIVFALPQRSISKALLMPAGSLIADVLQLAAADENFRGLDLAGAAVGVYGRVASRDQPLKDGDRVEIYRPLLEEPKLARRQRASRKASKSGRS
jgi:putative ubiquitin-RnfH superfamily antitoxin RatB of RatAB toxin-antitoxin module